MSFDINPLGNTLYLRQLEREVSDLNAQRETAGHDEARAAARPRGRLARLSHAIRSLRARPAT